jgi:drug/metabolite transporter (DMT)-like permease
MTQRLRDAAALTEVGAAFAAVALWSTNALAAKLALAELGVVQVLTLALCVGGFAHWVWASVGAWIASAYAGVGPMAGGFLLWRAAMSGDGAKRLAPLGYATPPLSTALLLFGETLAPGVLLGAALVLACSVGVLVVDRREHG